MKTRDGAEDPTFDAKANDLQKKIGGQGPTLTRPKRRMIEAKELGHNFCELWLETFVLFLSVKDSPFR